METEKNDRIKELEIKINSMGLAYENVLNVSHHYFSISIRHFYFLGNVASIEIIQVRDKKIVWVLFFSQNLFCGHLVRELLITSLDLIFILPLLCTVTCLLWPFSCKKLVALQNRQTVVGSWERAS